ncbi:MAG: SDR family NAD(P)-dependent oxidoreductase [Oscillospiraceae bacterium]|nr:SDR family NAD(P)-dependent oxidoreductase [Oscillospiraceae bacterium]
MSAVAIVTGGSSGIGRETALALLARGCRVYEFSRRENELPGVVHIGCDVSDEGQVRAAVEQVRNREGRVDILVNNAGYGISGAAEYTDNAQARRLMDVNLFGMVNGCKAVIPIMREQGGGRIVNLSSVAAPCAIPFQAWYSVSKSAVLTYSAALLNELRPFHIGVTAILPGDIKTGFTAAREKSPEGDAVYGGRIARGVAAMERDEQTGMDSAAAGRRIADIALRPSVKAEYSIGFKYQFFVILARLLPVRLKYWIIGRMYGQ